LDNSNVSDHDWEADHKSHMKFGNGIEAAESPEHRDVSATQNVSRLIWPTWRSMRQAEKELMTVTAMETRRYNGNKKQ